MTIQDLGALGELLGSVAVLATLVYLACAEARMAGMLLHYFKDFRSVEVWWAAHKRGFGPEFVEWVEEQRSNAAGVPSTG